MERKKRQGLKYRHCPAIGNILEYLDEWEDGDKNMKNIGGKPFLSVPFVVA